MQQEIPKQAVPQPPRVIDEDVYCLRCGYNLRGLSGRYLRCPECGSINDMEDAFIPAPMIHSALRKMETAPTVCVAGTALAALGLLTWAMDAGCFVILLGAGPALWIGGFIATGKAFEGRPGWRRIIVEFHVSALFCICGVPLSVAGFLSLSDQGDLNEQVWSGLLAFGGIGLVVAGLLVYWSARARLHEVQREAAVRIAREVLHRIRHRQGRRRLDRDVF